MLRANVEKLMKKSGVKQIDIVKNVADELAIYCTLQGGYLMDYTGHRVDRKQDLWGYLKWTDGKSRRIPFSEADLIQIYERSAADEI